MKNAKAVQTAFAIWYFSVYVAYIDAVG